MFETIRLHLYEGFYQSSRTEEMQSRMKDQYGSDSRLPDGESAFRISGKSSFLFGHPLDPEKEKELLFLQSFSYMETRKGYYTKRAGYPSFQLSYTYRGKGELNYGGRCYALSENDLFLIDCREPHSYRITGEEWDQCSLHFFGGNSEFLFRSLFRESGPVFRMGRDFFQPQLETLLKTCTSEDPLKDYQFSSQLTSLLLSVMSMNRPRRFDKSYASVETVRAYLDAHFTEDISLDDLAGMASLSKYHFLRLFREAVGMTPKHYITELRMKQASVLLMNTNIPSYRIGMLVGYHTEALFISRFKARFSMTPGEYRKLTQ